MGRLGVLCQGIQRISSVRIASNKRSVGRRRRSQVSV